jgi:hypothetical protein
MPETKSVTMAVTCSRSQSPGFSQTTPRKQVLVWGAPSLFGGGLDAQDLLELGHYHCYARLSDVRTGERLPAFSLQLEPPPESDTQLAKRLAYLSADRYGRDALDVELDLQAALQRIRGPRAPTADPEVTTTVATPGGEPLPDGIVAGNEVPPA